MDAHVLRRKMPGLNRIAVKKPQSHHCGNGMAELIMRQAIKLYCHAW
ncbi:hypothetical protein [Rhodopirellula sp. MGV]|nr:hypothetical protein [Rhodopirellula sp. MGV]